MAVADVMKMVKDNEVKFVDFRFTDTRGKEQHVSVPTKAFTEEKFTDGHAFDGSSIAGWKGIEVLTWHGLLAPAGTPAPIVERLQTEIQRGLLAPASKEKLAGDGVEVVASTPAELESFMRADMAKWGAVIKTAKIRPD